LSNPKDQLVEDLRADVDRKIRQQAEDQIAQIKRQNKLIQEAATTGNEHDK